MDINADWRPRASPAGRCSSGRVRALCGLRRDQMAAGPRPGGSPAVSRPLGRRSRDKGCGPFAFQNGHLLLGTLDVVPALLLELRGVDLSGDVLFYGCPDDGVRAFADD